MQPVSTFIFRDMSSYCRERQCEGDDWEGLVVLCPSDPIVGLVLEQDLIDQLLYPSVLVYAIMFFKCPALRLLEVELIRYH